MIILASVVIFFENRGIHIKRYVSATGLFISFSLLLSFYPVTVSAQGVSLSPQEQCFSTLKNNLSETSIFKEPLTAMGSTTYAEIAPQFSQKYKNLESFGIQVDQSVLSMRLYSFGRETGYVHPPELPFPSSYKSDIWKTPSKEYIIAEEYVTDPTGNENFLSCAFFQISSDNLTNVTRDRYLYDGNMKSLTKDSLDGSYKAWYSENTSFDYSDRPLVTWKRLFVYPQSTKNSYFDKYDVADAYPAHKVASFNLLDFFLNSPVEIEDYNKITGTSTSKYLVLDDKDRVKIVSPPSELLPVVSSGIDIAFPLASYYQAIDNQFPKFSELLSIRGTLKYNTFKHLASEQNLNPEVRKLLMALGNYKAVASYYSAKETQTKQGMLVSNPEMDGLLFALQNGDLAVKQLLNGATLETLKTQIPEALPLKKISSQVLVGPLVVLVAIIICLIWIWTKRKFIKNK